MVFPQEGVVTEATKPASATQELPTVLKPYRSPISADIHLADKKEGKCKQTSHFRRKRKHLCGGPQCQASKKHILEAGSLVCMQIDHSQGAQYVSDLTKYC